MMNGVFKISIMIFSAGVLVSTPTFAFKKLEKPTFVFRLDNAATMEVVNGLAEVDLTGVDFTVTGSVEKKPDGKKGKEVEAGPGPAAVKSSVASEHELSNYCYNISDSAVEARSAVLKEQLEIVEMQVDKKLVLLEEKTKALKAWMVKRESFVNKVNNSVVQIFQVMRPDAAASQFTELGPVIAASIISQLPPKSSSAILTEMSPVDAAEVALVLTAALDRDKKRDE